MGTRQIAVCALLCALNVVLARFFTVMPTAVVRFSIEAVPVLLAGYFFGPIFGMLVGFVGDTVGCMFSAYGWDPLISVSLMLVGAFAGLLRPLVYKLEKPWDVWKVAVTILPGKLLGYVVWTSLCFMWLGYSKKGLGVIMWGRATEAIPKSFWMPFWYFCCCVRACSAEQGYSLPQSRIGRPSLLEPWQSGREHSNKFNLEMET